MVDIRMQIKIKSVIISTLLAVWGASLTAMDVRDLLDRLEVRKIKIDIVWPDQFLIDEFWEKYSTIPAASIGLEIPISDAEEGFDLLTCRTDRKGQRRETRFRRTFGRTPIDPKGEKSECIKCPSLRIPIRSGRKGRLDDCV